MTVSAWGSGLGCAVYPTAGRCVRSTGYGGAGYLDNQACTITNPPAVPISVTSFSVEAHSSCAYDHLTVNGARYCGSNSPEGIVPDGTPIEWRTDGSATRAGWKLCFPQAPPPPWALQVAQPLSHPSLLRTTRPLTPLARVFSRAPPTPWRHSASRATT